MKNVMVDLETLGTTADAVIMSIGAVAFELDGDIDTKEAFYASVSIDSNMALGRKISEATLIWWLGQSEQARTVFHEPKMSLESALTDFEDWFMHRGEPNKMNIWSNGADFDIPMLSHAYGQLSRETPWLFYNSRCVRTYKTLPGMDRIQKPQRGIAHHALDDAINQVLLVQQIHQMLVEGKVTA